MDERVFSQLAQEHQDMLFRVAYTMLRSTEDCKDALQDALLKAWKNIHKLRKPEAFRSWMIHIVVNCAKDILRKKKIKTTELTDDLTASEASVQDEALFAALGQLPKDFRLTISLHYLEGFSIAEIAHIMHTSQGTVKNRLFRGRKQLAETLEKFRKEDEI